MIVRKCCAVLVALWLVGLSAAPAGAADDLALSTPADVLDAALFCPPLPSGSPLEPVLLVHGTGGSPESWAAGYAVALPALGYDVCTVQLPGDGKVDIQVASEYVVYAVRKMAALTGKKVDLIAHSQGGVEARWAVKWWPDVQSSVDDLVTLGTTASGLGDAGFVSLLCTIFCLPASSLQQTSGSKFLAALNSPDPTPGSVSYTSIWSYTDEVLQIDSLGARTADLQGASNFAIQDYCPTRYVSHGQLLTDGVVYAAVLDALTHPGPLDPSRLPLTVCSSGVIPNPNPPPPRPTDAGAVLTSVVQGVVSGLDVAGAAIERAGSSEPPLRPYTRSR